MPWPLRCVGREPFMLFGRLPIDRGRDGSERAQQMCRREAADPRETCGRIRGAHLWNLRLGPLIDWGSWIGAPALRLRHYLRFGRPNPALPQTRRGDRDALVR